MATYSLDEVMAGDAPAKKTYSLDEVLGASKPETTSLGARFVRGLRDPVDAGAQLLYHGVDKIAPNLVNDINTANNWIADKTGLVAKIPERNNLSQLVKGGKTGIDAMIEKQSANYHAPEGIDFARMGGNLLSPANLAVASKFPQAASLAGRVASGIGAGATLGALSPVEQGDFGNEKLKQVGIGAAAGGVLPIVTGAASRVISPKASTNPNIQLLQKEGVNPTVGQTLGGRANALEEKLQSVPIMGDMIATARGKANSQFEKAAFNRALKPIGQELPPNLSGRDALVHTENTLKNAYDDVLTNIGAIQPDATFSKNIANLQSMVNKQIMPKAEKAKFASAMSDVMQSIDDNGVITSDAYKALESSLGTDARKLGSSTNIYEGKLAPAVKQLQAELRGVLERQSGDNSKQLKAVNTAWANFKRVQNAAGKIGAEDGKFTPAQLQNAVRVLDKSKDKAAFARGNALMQDLGDAGKSVLGNKVPDSGTAQRLLYGGGALASGALNTMIPASLLGGGALYTQPAQKFLNSIVTSRPSFASPVANAVKQSSPYLTPALLGLLN